MSEKLERIRTRLTHVGATISALAEELHIILDEVAEAFGSSAVTNSAELSDTERQLRHLLWTANNQLHKADETVNFVVKPILRDLVEGSAEDASERSRQTLMLGTEDGDECPLCHNGTVEHVPGDPPGSLLEVKCRGECGCAVRPSDLQS